MGGKDNPDRQVSWAQVAAFRLARHHLAGARRASLVEVCRDVCGIQAQLMASAEMAIWARKRDLARDDIATALWERRTLVKTHLMRQTLHLIPAADFSLYISALKRSRVAGVRQVMSRLDITDKEAAGLTAAIVGSLADGPRTQKEIRARVRPKMGKRVKKWMDLVWSAVRPAVVEGLACYGPDRGAETTYVLTAQWLPKQKPVSESEAKAILLRRFLGAFGPATVQDFSKWAGMPAPEARAAWDSLGKELAPVSVEGWPAMLLRKDLASLARAALRTPVVCLLPNFDVYLLAHASKTHLLPTEHYKRVFRNQGWISPVVLLDGRIIATWSSTRRGKGMILEVQPFEKISKAVRAGIEQKAASWGAFLETYCEMKVRE